MSSFKFTRNLALEVGEAREEEMRNFGRALSDVFDLALLGAAAWHFFAPGQHMLQTMVVDFMDAGMANEVEVQGNQTPAVLTKEQLATVQAAIMAQSQHPKLQPRALVATLEPEF